MELEISAQTVEGHTSSTRERVGCVDEMVSAECFIIV